MTDSGARAERRRALLGQGEDAFKRLLLPQERLLAQVDFSKAAGKNRLENPPDTRSTARKVAETSAGAVLQVALQPDSPSLKRMLGGTASEGHLGSWASRLNEAYVSLLGKNRSQYLLVTDRRLLLASGRIFGRDPDNTIHLEIPRAALAAADLEGRPFTRGRVVIRFTDGSMIALDLGTWRTKAAQSFVQALAAPGTVPAPPA